MKTAQPVEAPAALPMGVIPMVMPAESAPPEYLALNLHYPGLKKVFATQDMIEKML